MAQVKITQLVDSVLQSVWFRAFHFTFIEFASFIMLFFFWKTSGNSIAVALLSSWIFSFKKHLHLAWDAVSHLQIKLREESWKYDNLGISDHHLIYAVINLRRTYHKPALKVIRDFKNVDVSALRHEFASAPWNICDIFDDIDDSVWA